MADGPGKVRSIEAVVTAEAAACEQARTLTPRVVDAMWDSGLFRYMNPAEAGGDEPGFREMIETWIAMAALDGSFGWTGLANFSSTAASAAYLPDQGFAEVFGRAAGSSAHSATSTPAPSTCSSTRRWPARLRRSGSAWWRITGTSERDHRSATRGSVDHLTRKLATARRVRIASDCRCPASILQRCARSREAGTARAARARRSLAWGLHPYLVSGARTRAVGRAEEVTPCKFVVLDGFPTSSVAFSFSRERSRSLRRHRHSSCWREFPTSRRGRPTIPPCRELARARRSYS